MESEKVFLRVATPFSLKDANTLRMTLMTVSTPIFMVAVAVMLHNTEPADSNVPALFTMATVLWCVLGLIPCALMIFNSYVRIKDEELVVNAIGFFEKRYPRSALQKAVKSGSRIEIHSAGKAIVAIPDNDAARNLVRKLRISADWDNQPV